MGHRYHAGWPPRKAFPTIMPASVESSSIIYDATLPESVEAPIEKGEVLGTPHDEVCGSDAGDGKPGGDGIPGAQRAVHTLDIGRDILSSNWFVAIL